MPNPSEAQAAPTQRTSADIEAELLSLTPPAREAIPDTALPPGKPAAAAAATVDPDVSAATRKGWVPKDQYSGDPSKFVDARTFLDRGERFNSNLQREVAALKAKIDSFEGTKTAFKKFHEETIAAKDAQLKEAISSLRIQRSQAIREGEDETAIQLEDRIELLNDERKSVKAIAPTQAPERQPGPNTADPVFLEWVEDGNQWFSEDKALADFAVTLGEGLIANGETRRGRKFLDLVREQMEENFPRRFKEAASKTQRNNPVDGGSGKASITKGVNGGKTEADLPAEDFALMKQFIKEGLTTKETFLKSYYSRNA